MDANALDALDAHENALLEQLWRLRQQYEDNDDDDDDDDAGAEVEAADDDAEDAEKGKLKASGACALEQVGSPAFMQRMHETLRAMVAHEVSLQLDSRVAALWGNGAPAASFAEAVGARPAFLTPPSPQPLPQSLSQPLSQPLPLSSPALPAPTFAQLAEMERELCAERARVAELSAQLDAARPRIPAPIPAPLHERLQTRPPTHPQERPPSRHAGADALKAFKAGSFPAANVAATAPSAPAFAKSLFEQADSVPPAPLSASASASASTGQGAPRVMPAAASAAVTAAALRKHAQQQQELAQAETKKPRRRDFSGMGAIGAVHAPASLPFASRPANR